MTTTSMISVVLGYDVSTQSCKCVAVEKESLKILTHVKVQYDIDLPHYHTKDGIHRVGTKITSPSKMWLEALDLVTEKILHLLSLEHDISPSQVVAISGSGQQHGTVYWANDGKIDLSIDLNQQLSCTNSPIWMDNSTKEECQELETFIGGKKVMQELTGSTCIERFSIHHIVSLRKKNIDVFQKTKRVSLVSSFGASVFCGEIAPIDITDAAGMNAMNIREQSWSPKILQFCGISEQMLGQLVKPWDIVGQLSNYWTNKYNLSSTAKIVSWSGDNPCAVVGMGLVEPGDILISLGTSDTCIFVVDNMPENNPCSFGHFFPHPLLARAFFGMLVYSNGDITRRKIRDEYASGSWDIFTSCINETVGMDAVGAYWSVDEISPPVSMREPILFENGNKVAAFSHPSMNCRAVIESRAIIMKKHLDYMRGNTEIKRILITGGATNNQAIVQIFSDVFQKPVVGLEMSEAAAYGAAIRATYSISDEDEKRHILANIMQGSVLASPNVAEEKRYKLLAPRIHDILEEFKAIED